MRIALLVLALASSASAFAQTCDPSVFGDGVCDCGCGTRDPDCPPGKFQVCQRSHCAAGQVPWEHQPHTCMSSACGDGWNDPRSGEMCDDGNALASGGCNATCRAVNDGYTCGPNASGCSLGVDAGAPDAGAPATDGGAGDAGAPGDGQDAGAVQPPPMTQAGCSAVPAGLLAPLGMLLARRRRGR